MPADAVLEAAARLLAEKRGVDPSTVSSATLTSGASRRSWRLDAGGRSYVLQQEVMPRSALPPQMAEFAPVGMADQAAAVSAAHRAGVPVPEVIGSGTCDDRQFMLCEFLEGEALPPKLLRDPALADGVRVLHDDCARALVAIQSIPAGDLELRQQDRLATYRPRLDAFEPRPVLELGYRWLIENRPAPGPQVVVHGDFRLGNLLVGPNGLQAVLDWELVHVGDRHEDVAWASIRAWRFDRHRPAGTFPDEALWFDAYDRAAGPGGHLDRAAVRWWQVAGTWSWAVMSAMQARRHLDGWGRSLEHAVIGRRVCESEWDLLSILPEPGGHLARAPLPVPPTPGGYPAEGDLHGRPTAAELIDALIGWLREDLPSALEGGPRHQARIAVRALETVGRELAYGPQQEAAHRQRLAGLGFADDASLAAAIRDGAVEDGPDLRAALWADTAARLAVANPSWASPGS